MRSQTVIYLITETAAKNEFYDPTVTKVERKTYADQLDIGMSEFYQAQNTDLKPIVKFKIRYAEYNQEVRMRHGTKDYRIIKAFSKDQEFIELTGSDLQNDS